MNTFYSLQHVLTIFIVIHGTWGSDTTWYAPGGDFFDALEISAQKEKSSVVPFMWSGYNSNEARLQAAHNLARLIETYDSATPIIIVAHSHGGTVALLASHLITKNKIFCLYTLGTPINKALYPNMQKIDFCYNLFSFEDLVQPVLGMFNREHPPHERIANIRVIINDKEPNHSELHDPIVGTWLPLLHNIITTCELKIKEPGVIHFTDTQAPTYYHDIYRQESLERDHQLSLLILHSLRKSLAIESKIPLTNL